MNISMIGSCLGSKYNPAPPRVWSRVENPCIFPLSGYDTSPTEVYVPVTGTYMDSGEYNAYYKPMFLKGNILQYKKNSANLTQQQRYSKIARGQWTNRTKTWATQSQTYTNPNTGSLARVGTFTTSATTPTGYQNPWDCSNNPFIDGGTLIGTQTVNPCSGALIQQTFVQTCNLNDACDVPGAPVSLCWTGRVPTWYPRQRYVMPTSGSKWPVNYKFLRSANGVTPQNVDGVGSY